MRQLFPSLRGLPRAYWYLWAGALLNRLGGFVFPFLALYLTGVRHLSVSVAGTILGLCGAGSFAAGPAGGWLADRLGRRPAILAGLVLGPISLLVLGFAATTPAEIAVAALAFGFFGDLYRPVNMAMVADIVPPADRPRAYGILYWAINLGFAVASVLGGVMAHRNFGALFVLDAATTLGFAAVVLLRIPETRAPGLRSERSSMLRDLSAPARDLPMVAFTLLSFGLGVIFLQANSTLPIDMRAHGLSTDVYGWLLAINGVLIVLVSPVAMTFIQGMRRDHALALAATLVGLGFGVNALGHSVPMVAAGIVVWTFGEIFQASVQPTMIAELAPPDRRGVYQGFHMMSWGAAYFLAPQIGSRVLERLGGNALWGGCVTIGFFCAAGHLVFGAWRRRIAVTAGELPAVAASE